MILTPNQALIKELKILIGGNDILGIETFFNERQEQGCSDSDLQKIANELSPEERNYLMDSGFIPEETPAKQAA